MSNKMEITIRLEEINKNLQELNAEINFLALKWYLNCILFVLVIHHPLFYLLKLNQIMEINILISLSIIIYLIINRKSKVKNNEKNN